MKKTKLSIYLDSLSIAITISIILFLWLYWKIKNAKLIIFCCILGFILLFFVVFKFLNNKFNLKNIGLYEQKFANSCLNKLIYSTQNFNNNFFKNLLQSKIISENIFENQNSYFYINLKTHADEKTFHFANEFYINTNNNKPFIFILNQQTESFSSLVINSPIKYTVLNFNNLYLLMKHKNIYPINEILKTQKFTKLKNIKNKTRESLSKKSFFKFFISGFSLITLSIFMPFSFYYLFIGSILLLLSIFCLLSKNNLTNTSNIDLISLTKKD